MCIRDRAIPFPGADVYHATGAVSVSLMGLVAQREKGTPFLLTEHGVYLRERAISVSTDTVLSFFQKHFLVSMADAISRLCYHFADLITPVCSFNGKWERNLGTDPRKIRVIYNAIDTDRFVPSPKPAETAARPTRPPPMPSTAHCCRSDLTITKAGSGRSSVSSSWQSSAASAAASRVMCS